MSIISCFIFYFLLKRLFLAEVFAEYSPLIQGLASLIVLNLSNNHISRLQSGLFEDLANLQILDGSHNQIEQIPQGNRQSNKISKTCLTFKKLSSLKTGMSGMR